MGVRVLVVGSGAREHALAWRLALDPEVGRVWVAPGNAGIPREDRVPLAATDLEGLLAWARRERPDLTVVGPEAPLAAGLADRFREAGLLVFGPTREAARLEASKAFAKALMREAGVPTADFRSFDDELEALRYLADHPLPVVVKASGLAAGKGVLVTDDRAEAQAFVRALFSGRFGEAGRTVLIEEFLKGPELSVLAVTDGERVRLLPPARDYKRALDGGRGPNTGGMGACSPPSDASEALLGQVEAAILRPVLKAMRARGTPFTGVLYAGLKLTPEGPKVLEFNARFGDPEAQAVLPRLSGSLYRLLASAARGALEPEAVGVRPGAALTVVMASGGYPGSYRTGFPVEGLAEAAALEGVLIFHAGTEVEGGRVVTAGGRVLAITGMGATLEEARARAYRGVRLVRFSGAHYRRDIGEGC